jgi:IclR family transcriptional regulator, KDG regulon repressor
MPADVVFNACPPRSCFLRRNGGGIPRGRLGGIDHVILGLRRSLQSSASRPDRDNRPCTLGRGPLDRDHRHSYAHSVKSDSTSREFERESSAHKALRILECVATTPGLSLAEIEAQLRLPKPTLLRLLQVLVSTGFVDRPARNRYRPALKMWRLGCNAVSYDDVRLQVLPLLQELVAETGESAHYAVYELGYSVYVEKVDGNQAVRAYTSVGSRSPAFASATGKALLAWQGTEEVERVMRSAERFTKTTVTTAAEFEQSAQQIRARGWAVNSGEWRGLVRS